MAQLQKFQALLAGGTNGGHTTKVGACLMVTLYTNKNEKNIFKMNRSREGCCFQKRATVGSQIYASKIFCE